MCLFPVHLHVKAPEGFGVQTVSCGKCLECVRQRSVEWSFRIMDECSQYSENCFLTLTYDEEHLPENGSVSRREVQLFMKRLRKALRPLRVRFFACGEYGKKLLRPHYHIIIFGWYPSDSWFFQRKDGSDLFRSPTVEKAWTFGFSTVGRVTLDTALYCAKYMNKFDFDSRYGKNKKLYPPFVQMSNRPGIGFDCVYRCDLQTDRIYRNGRSCKIPRYYLKVMERDGIYLDDFKALRQAQGEVVARYTDLKVKRNKLYNKYLGRDCIPKIDRPR